MNKLLFLPRWAGSIELPSYPIGKTAESELNAKETTEKLLQYSSAADAAIQALA